MADPKDIDESYIALGRRLQEARERAGKTQEQTAEYLGKHWTMIYRYEAGRSRIRLGDLGVLAGLFGVTVSWLLGEQGAPKPTDPLSSRVAQLPEEYRAVVETVMDALERNGRKPVWGR